MLTMFRKVTHLLRLIPSIVAGLMSFADLVANSFMGRAHAFVLEGEELTAAHLSTLQKVLGRMIDFDGRELAVAEKVLRECLRIEKHFLNLRDKAAKGLYEVLLKARKSFEVFGQGMSALYVGLDPGLSRAEAQVLLRYGHEAMDVLTDPEFKPPPGGESSVGQLKAFAEEIRPKVEELESATEEYEDKKRESQKALKLKTQKVERCEETLIYGARLNEALYVLAGESFHAARLRPHVGRGGSVEADPILTIPDTGDGEGDVTPEPTDSSPDGADSANTVEATG